MDQWDEAARRLTGRLDLLRWAFNSRTPGLSSCMKRGTIYMDEKERALKGLKRWEAKRKLLISVTPTCWRLELQAGSLQGCT